MNYMAYIRGNKRDFDLWEKKGNKNWSYDHVLEYFKKSEGNLNPKYVEYDNGKYHNAHGPLLVKRNFKLPYSKMFKEAGKEFCIKPIFDINSDETLGYVNIQATIDGFRRVSTAKAFLAPVKYRPNLNIIKHALATKILFDSNKRAIGVEFEYDGPNGKQNMTAYANKEIIVSAGAIGSPQLLMLSGIGRNNHLEEFNIETISDLPVGKSLFDHPATYVFFKFKPRKIYSTQTLDDFYDYLINKMGPFTSFGDLSGFVNTKKCGGYPDIQLLYSYFYRNTSDLLSFMTTQNYSENIQKKLLEENQKSDIAGVVTVVLQPKSRGVIDLISSSPYDHPRIRPKYYSNPYDMKTMLRGVKQQIAFEKTKAYKKHGGKFMHIPVEKCDQYEFKSDEYLECYINYFSITMFHPCGMT